MQVAIKKIKPLIGSIALALIVATAGCTICQLYREAKVNPILEELDITTDYEIDLFNQKLNELSAVLMGFGVVMGGMAVSIYACYCNKKED